jgi:hypothetical protein
LPHAQPVSTDTKDVGIRPPRRFPNRLAFAALIAGIDDASVPLVVLRVRAAKPAITFFAEYGRGHIARLVQTGDACAGGLWLAGRIFPDLLRFHGESLPVFYSEREARDRQV